MNGGSFESQCTQIGENMWSKDAILTFCQLYHNHRFLWDTKHPEPIKRSCKNANTGRKTPCDRVMLRVIFAANIGRKERQYWQKNARKMIM